MAPSPARDSRSASGPGKAPLKPARDLDLARNHQESQLRSNYALARDFEIR